MYMYSSSPSRRSLPHLARLRARPDLGPGSLAALAALLLFLTMTTLFVPEAQAQAVRTITVSEDAQAQVSVQVVADRVPTFQVFRLPGERTFAIELPGITLAPNALQTPSDGVLLANTRIDTAAQNHRVILRFHGEVDFEARTTPHQLTVVFEAVSDLTPLRVAHQRRVSKAADQTADIRRGQAELKALEQTRLRLEQEREDLLAQNAKWGVKAKMLDDELQRARANERTIGRQNAELQRRVAELQEQLQVTAQQHARRDAELRREIKAVPPSSPKGSETDELRASRLRRDIEALEARMKALRAEEQQKTEERSRHSQDVEARQQALLEQERRNREQQERSTSLQRQVQGLEQQMAALSNDLQKERARHEKIRTDIDMERGLLAEARRSRQEAEVNVQALKGEVESARAALSELNQRRVQAENERDRARRSREEEQQAERLQHDNQLKRMTQDRANLEQQIQQVAAALSSKRREAESLEQRAIAASTRLAKLTQQESAANQGMADTKRTLARLREDEQQLNLRVQGLQQQLRETQKRHAEVQQHTQTLEARADALEKRLTQQTNQAKRLEDLRRNVSETEERLRQLDTQIQQRQTESERWQRRVEHLTRQVAQKASAETTTRRGSEAPHPGDTTAAKSNVDHRRGRSPLEVQTGKRYRWDTQGFEDGFGGASDEPGRGVLSYVTIQRKNARASRVGLRVDQGARFAIERAGDRELLLTLFDTRAANLDVRRILDATSLQTSVLRVVPQVQESNPFRVQLKVELREDLPVRLTEDDTMLWIYIGS